MSGRPPAFDLSQLKVLQSLEVLIWKDKLKGPDIPHIVQTFRTITSPAFSELVVIPPYNKLDSLLSSTAFVEALRTMSLIRPFKLIFSVELWYTPWLGGPPSWEEQRAIETVVEKATAKGLLDFLSSPPTVQVRLILTRRTSTCLI